MGSSLPRDAAMLRLPFRFAVIILSFAPVSCSSERGVILACRSYPSAGSCCASVWYRKPRPTFADTLAAGRRQFWREQGLMMSPRLPKMRKLHPALRHGIAYAFCHAA
jgi:hypothetical protein